MNPADITQITAEDIFRLLQASADAGYRNIVLDTGIWLSGFEAVLDRSADFYGVYLCGAAEAEILALAAKQQELDGPFLLFYSVTGTAVEVTAPTALLARLKASGTRRALGFYAHAITDAAAVMGTAMGLASARSDAAFALCYKPVNAVEPADLTEFPGGRHQRGERQRLRHPGLYPLPAGKWGGGLGPAL
jgi:hypothetical protein